MGLTDLTRDQFEERLETALGLDLPYSDRIQRVLPDRSSSLTIPAAVLILFAYPRYETSFGPSVLFTRRTESVETHKGQMAFPGGHCEPEDVGGPSVTALRE